MTESYWGVNSLYFDILFSFYCIFLGLSILSFVVDLVKHSVIVWNKYFSDPEEQMILGYIGAVLIYIVICFFAYTVGQIWTYEDYTVGVFLFLNIVQAVYIIVTGVLPGRLSQMEMSSVEELLLAKQALVRHIGHEIRTPLNMCSVCWSGGAGRLLS